MIIEPQEIQKQNIILLWKESFPHDSPEFIKLYFAQKYQKENTLIYLHDDKIVSCLQMLPYDLKYYNNICESFYISGASTQIEYRNKGFMGKLLTHAILKMKNRGALFTILIPQEEPLIKYYQKYGYTPAFGYTKLLITHKKFIPDPSVVVTKLLPEEMEEAFVYYQRSNYKKNLLVLKSFDDFKTIYENLKLIAGETFICRRDKRIRGICFCSFAPQELNFLEMVSGEKRDRDPLFYEIIRQYPNREVYYFQRPYGNRLTLEIKGMARILDAEKVLGLYALHYYKMTVTLKVNDNLIAENNGIFYLNNGYCERKYGGNFDFEVDINLLTQLLLGFRTEGLPQEYSIFPQKQPYMSLMLE
jgi:predicted acetyltransferase